MGSPTVYPLGAMPILVPEQRMTGVPPTPGMAHGGPVEPCYADTRQELCGQGPGVLEGDETGDADPLEVVSDDAFGALPSGVSLGSLDWAGPDGDAPPRPLPPLPLGAAAYRGPARGPYPSDRQSYAQSFQQRMQLGQQGDPLDVARFTCAGMTQRQQLFEQTGQMKPDRNILCERPPTVQPEARRPRPHRSSSPSPSPSRAHMEVEVDVDVDVHRSGGRGSHAPGRSHAQHAHAHTHGSDRPPSTHEMLYGRREGPFETAWGDDDGNDDGNDDDQ